MIQRNLQGAEHGEDHCYKSDARVGLLSSWDKVLYIRPPVGSVSIMDKILELLFLVALTVLVREIKRP